MLIGSRPWRISLTIAAGLVLSGASVARAQQPFVVDDADVTPARVWHLEVSNQIDGLRRSARPARWQNALEWEVDYGLLDRLEVGVVVPLLTIGYASDDPRGTDSGVGDTTFGLKYRFSSSADTRHVFGGSLSLELPSGDRARQLGSGLVDYGVNGIWQFQIDERWTLRSNAGVVLAGNTQTGVVGIRERGAVLTGGSSLVAAVSDRVQLGGEFTFAWSPKATLAGSLVAWQTGGNFVVRKGMTLDLALSGGWHDASPRIGLQVGTSIDLTR